MEQVLSSSTSAVSGACVGQFQTVRLDPQCLGQIFAESYSFIWQP
jgi:hypothetical protein